MKLLRVRFLDHYTTIEERIKEKFHLECVGWLISEDKNYVRLAMTIDDDGELSSPYMNILKNNIVSRRELK